MENLPDAMISEILRRIDKTADRNAVSIVSIRLCNIEAYQRELLRVGCGLHPASEALISLCTRFPNLTRLEIDYSGWMSSMGKQLDNLSLLTLSSHCPKLVDLTLSFCAFIGDCGIGYLAACENLRALTLNFVPGVTSCGLLLFVAGCKKLSSLHLSRCMNVRSAEWLGYLGQHGNLDSLSIKNCRGFGQDDLVILGPGWKKLRRLEFVLDKNDRYHAELPASKWNRLELICDNLRELILVNCCLDPGRVLTYVVEGCYALEKLLLDVCIGLQDSNMSALSQKSCELRKLSLRLTTEIPVSVHDLFKLTDRSLKELAHGCSLLEEVELSFSGWEYSPDSCFTLDGILNLLQSCPIRVLALNNAYFWNDVGMNALCSAHFLQVLELEKCQDVTDVGIKCVMKFPCLKYLKLSKCLAVTDSGLKPLVGSGKLDSLIVEDCILISETGVQGTARYVSYRQDLSWMH